MILLLHFDDFTRCRECAQGRFFIGWERYWTIRSLDGPGFAREPAAFLLGNLDMATNAHVDQRRGEGAVVGVHLGDVAHAAGVRPSGGENSGTTVPARGSRPARRQAKK